MKKLVTLTLAASITFNITAFAQEKFFPSYDYSAPSASQNIENFQVPDYRPEPSYPSLDRYPTMDGSGTETRMTVSPDTSFGGNVSDSGVEGNYRFAPDWMN
ncbi:hypothetical protein ACQZ4R_20755 [Agrobacterium vitis]